MAACQSRMLILVQLRKLLLQRECQCLRVQLTTLLNSSQVPLCGSGTTSLSTFDF